MADLRRVLLMADAASGYDRDVMRGVGHYSSIITAWVCRHYGIELHNPQCEALIEKWHPTGIISAAATWSSPLSLARSRGIPVVQAKQLNEQMRDESVPLIYTDQKMIASLVAEYFAGIGLTSLAFAGSAHGFTYPQDEFLRAQAERFGFKYNSFHGEPRSETDPQLRFSRWLEALPKKTGILASSDWFAYNVIGECAIAGFRVPDDFAVVGIGDDSPWCQLAAVPLSSVSLAGEKIGYRAASLLDQLMRGETPGETPSQIPPIGIVARRSTEVIAAEDPDIAAALRYINDHAAQGCTVKQLLRNVPIDRRRLERWCQQQLGHSPLDEIQRLRITNVKRLLAETDERVEEIARMAGYVSATVLCRAFSRETSTTVAKYRRQFRRASNGRSVV